MFSVQLLGDLRLMQLDLKILENVHYLHVFTA